MSVGTARARSCSLTEAYFWISQLVQYSRFPPVPTPEECSASVPIVHTHTHTRTALRVPSRIALLRSAEDAFGPVFFLLF